MQRPIFLALVSVITGAVPAMADPPFLPPPIFDMGPPPSGPAMRQATPRSPDMGGGLIEFLFGGANGSMSNRVEYGGQPFGGYEPAPTTPQRLDARLEPVDRAESGRPTMDPRFMRQRVAYYGAEKPGTVVINTEERFLYLVEGDGKALRYGIGVGRPGFSWAGVKEISMKREWPEWRPPDEMLKRRPDLPRYMPGGPENPLGARAMYLGSSLYRIHGSNEPWTIGTAVSSGCIRMRNEDVIDLYDRVKVGTKVVVI